MTTASKKELLVLDVKPGIAMESQSGIAQLWPKIYGALVRADGKSRTAAIVMHPASNFMGHYLLEPMAAAGITMLGLNSRYVNNDSQLIMERVLQDLGAGVRHLRGQGYEKILLIGNSGGAALASYYQAQAENFTATHTPAGDPTGLSPLDLPPVDGIVLTAAHPGRSRLFSEWLDPSVIDERDPFSADPALDMFNPANGPAFAPEWLARYRAAQLARNARIEQWARAQLAYVRALPHGVRDMAFVIYRTAADPRHLDPSIDPNDRPAGTIWGEPREINYGANNIGRYTTLTAYLSQWAACTFADGPSNLVRTSVPVLSIEHTADASVVPAMNALWVSRTPGRIVRHTLVGGTHYLAGQPEKVRETVQVIASWAQRI
ncbi:pimeloyl-ACP methyl ester carboxylesterase [Variovorax boronicumulans]|uniref:Pimeloyl-ACP methyl ester carboxylesterase n=1 Tax=Variovorax boronicumulans TaxID=436515 RepID=A0AAW8DVD6_9BURK|nr:alpha/beta hydrolase [Variovorax boronicumulans]MDP9878009.1 pimeloyl-ACP methyl ester carboxylesterase [Variovorax boronicumulans]MDP9923292.1 pimeloyl-ACP methyl ester carboxylesterase [Variovorax boronicumulans]